MLEKFFEYLKLIKKIPKNTSIQSKIGWGLLDTEVIPVPKSRPNKTTIIIRIIEPI